MAEKKINKTVATPYQKELIETVKKIREFKLATEANIVSILYKNKELYFTYSNLKLSDFSNNAWKVYFQIGQDVVIKEQKMLDEITINFYLEKHSKLKDKYVEYGGYDTISKASEYVNTDNIDGYVKELYKWNTVLQMAKDGFPVSDRLSELTDMGLEEIYDEYEAKLNHLFINAETDVVSHNAYDGLSELIEELNKGHTVGLPLHSCPMLTKQIGGLNKGNMYMLGAGTGVGKTTFSIGTILPSIIENNEKLVLIVNEQDEKKVKSELLIFVANNILKKEITKYQLRDGKFSKETKDILIESAKWLEDRKEESAIIIIPLEKYRADLVCKIMKKYAQLGFDYFILDTLKLSEGTSSSMIWQEMMQDSIKLFDVIKPMNKNVTLWVTYQLGKQSLNQRYLNNNSVGQSKSITDVASVNTMIRVVLDDEKDGGKHAIKAFRLEGKHGKTKIPFSLHQDKHYMVLFITKNRFGESDIQIIYEVDMGRNVFIERGICMITPDF